MNITGPIRQLIVDDTNAGVLLGSRVFPVVLPQPTAYPAVTLSIVTVAGNGTKTGPSTEDLINLKISTFAETYNEAQQSDDAIRAAIDYYRGVVTVGAVAHGIDLVEFESSTDMPFEAEPKMFHRASYYRVRYSRNPAAFIPESLVGGNYDSDESALAAGLEYGQYYHAYEHVAEANGVLIKLIE